METIYPDIPRICTAMAEWIMCFAYVSFLPKRYAGRKNILFCIIALLLQIFILVSTRQYAAEILDFMYDPGSRMYVCIYLYVLRTYYRTGFVLLRNCIYTCRIYRFTGMAALYLSSKMEPAVSGRKPYPACDYLYWNVLGCFLSGSCTFDKRIFTGTLCMGTYLNRCAGNYDIRFQQHQFSGCRPAF